MAVGKIQENPYNRYQTQLEQQKTAQKLASGKKINRAADDVAGAAISEKMIQKINQENAEIEEYQNRQSMLNISDGMNAGISDYLMDMYQQGVRSGNSLLSADDRAAIKSYSQSLKEGAESLASTTKYNEQYVGNNTVKAALESLSGDSGLDDIDSAMKAVNDTRSQEGAEFNGLEHRINEKQQTVENLTAAESRIADTEYGSAVSDYRRNQTIENYRNTLQNQQMNNNSSIMSSLV